MLAWCLRRTQASIEATRTIFTIEQYRDAAMIQAALGRDVTVEPTIADGLAVPQQRGADVQQAVLHHDAARCLAVAGVPDTRGRFLLRRVLGPLIARV